MRLAMRDEIIWVCEVCGKSEAIGCEHQQHDDAILIVKESYPRASKTMEKAKSKFGKNTEV